MDTAYFNKFTIDLPEQAIIDCSHQGECVEDVKHWEPHIFRSMYATPEAVRAELREYGYLEEELVKDESNWINLIWIACHNIKEERRNECQSTV